MKFLKRVSEEQIRKLASVEVNDPEFRREMPALAEYLYATTDVDGKPRKTGTIVVFVDGVGVKAFFSDKQTELQLCVTASGVLDALRALDEALQGDPVPWRRLNSSERAQSNAKGKRG